jgi:hypothetical protein
LGDLVLNQAIRTSFGQTVKDIAWQYFVGLKGISPNEAKEQFEIQLQRGDPLALSALRMAEKEVLSPDFR